MDGSGERRDELMGMFDNITCEILELGGGFQTKDTDQPFVSNYTITAAGRLILHHHETEAERDVDQNFDGDIHFYNSDTYRATFRCGDCAELSKMDYVSRCWVQIWTRKEIDTTKVH